MKKIQSKIKQYIKAYSDQFAFSGSIGVMHEGKVIYTEGIGLANREYDIENQSNTRHKVWSITKQFTAASILILEESGLLSVEDKVKDYFKVDSKLDERITIHHLLNHSSGLANYSDREDAGTVFYKVKHKKEERLKAFLNAEMDFEPGEGWNYSNTGYYLLGQIIEKVSGMTYPAFLSENIFEVLDMKDTGVENRSDVIKNKSNGYYLNAGDLINCEYCDMELIGPSGGMYSTVEDLLKWDLGLRNHKILSQEALKKMRTVYQGDYGYGIFASKINDKKIVRHGGGLEGFLSEMHNYLDESLTIVVLSNYGFTAVYKLCEEIGKIVLGIEFEQSVYPKKASLAPEIHNKMVGLYKEEGFQLEITKVDDRYVLRMDDEFDLWAYPVDDKTLHHEWIDEAYEFDIDDAGNYSIWGVEKVK